MRQYNESVQFPLDVRPRKTSYESVGAVDGESWLFGFDWFWHRGIAYAAW